MLPPSFVTKTLLDPILATPTKILGVAEPDEPEVLSKVTQEIPVNVVFNILMPEELEGGLVPIISLL